MASLKQFPEDGNNNLLQQQTSTLNYLKHINAIIQVHTNQLTRSLLQLTKWRS